MLIKTYFNKTTNTSVCVKAVFRESNKERVFMFSITEAPELIISLLSEAKSFVYKVPFSYRKLKYMLGETNKIETLFFQLNRVTSLCGVAAVNRAIMAIACSVNSNYEWVSWQELSNRTNQQLDTYYSWHGIPFDREIRGKFHGESSGFKSDWLDVNLLEHAIYDHLLWTN